MNEPRGPGDADATAEDWGSWESTRTRQLLAGLAVSADERIAWVEEMLVIATASGACPRPRDAWGQPLPTDGSTKR